MGFEKFKGYKLSLNLNKHKHADRNPKDVASNKE